MRNLKLEELFVGAWVCLYHEVSDRLSPPMRVTGVWGEGDMYLDIDGNEGDPYDATIGEVRPVRIDSLLLRHFGFVRTKGDNVWMKKVGDFRLTVALRMRRGVQCVRRAAISGRTNCWNEELLYVHELQRWWIDKVMLPFGVRLPLEWIDIKDSNDE